MDPIGAAAGHCFLQTIHMILFSEGRPRYGQTPPIGGILLCDLVKAGAMVNYNLLKIANLNLQPLWHRFFTKERVGKPCQHSKVHREISVT